MKFLLEKLSQNWQLRFLAVCAGVALVVYAVVMPVHSTESLDSGLVPVSAASSEPVSDTNGRGPGAPVASSASGQSVSGQLDVHCMGENRAAAAQLQLAASSYLEEDLPRDFSGSIRALRSAADQGNAVAQFMLGHAYQLGLGVPKDMTQTTRWYARAGQPRNSESLDAGAQPAPRDFVQAFETYKNVADAGEAGAELYMGLGYDLGIDLPRSAVEAARWYRKAAAQGSSSAENNLGVLYRNGDGMPKDCEEAAVWFGKAAARGNANAQYSLGRMYLQGDGIERSYAQAAQWLEKAAGQGNAPAEVLLSTMYVSGQGVPGSTAKAYMWINLASARVRQARDSRDSIEKEIPEAEIAEGQKLTHAWLIQHSQSLY
jgi:TPR repeat protein